MNIYATGRGEGAPRSETRQAMRERPSAKPDNKTFLILIAVRVPCVTAARLVVSKRHRTFTLATENMQRRGELAAAARHPREQPSSLNTAYGCKWRHYAALVMLAGGRNRLFEGLFR